MSIKSPARWGCNKLSKMSIDLQYGNVSPARYPNPGRKRKSTKSAPPAGKKKKEEKENMIQPMTPEDCDPVVCEVVEDTRAAVEEMMKELNHMVDQAAQDPSSVDYMVCPCHEVRLEARESQKGWKYVKCPMQPCLLFCGQDQALEYMKAVYSQPHVEVLDMWCCLQCFCREPATLQQSQSTQNPDRLFLNCSKKTCSFFRWADQPLGPKYWTWFHDHPPKKPMHSLNRPPVMLKDIPRGVMTSLAHPLQSKRKRTWNENGP